MSNAASRDPSEPQFREFRTFDDMNAVLVQDIVHRLTDGVARRGHASLVASGGTTPGAMFDLLACADVPWRDIAVTLSDDRWIETTSDHSNEKLVRSRLLTAKAAAARFVPLKMGHRHAQDARHEVDTAVRAMPRPFDVVLLGMGTDGHIASLIPGAEGLARALDRRDNALVQAIHPADLSEKGERLSLTLRALLEARRIIVLLRGVEKREAYRWVMRGADPLQAPARALLRQTEVPVSVCWAP